MDKNKSKQLPDFDELNDRVIAEAAPSPTFVIKTNLDPKDISEENPYYNPNSSAEEKEKLKKFFD